MTVVDMKKHKLKSDFPRHTRNVKKISMILKKQILKVFNGVSNIILKIIEIKIQYL